MEFAMSKSTVMLLVFIPALFAAGCVTNNNKSDPARNNKPGWVDKPDTVYDEKHYIARVGFSRNRRQAEAGAFAIQLSSSMDQLIGAEILTRTSPK
jgi:hypothetical protein